MTGPPPPDVAVAFRQALVALHLGRARVAEAELRRLWLAAPDRIDIACALAHALELLGRPDDALQTLAPWRTTHPHHVPLCVAIARCELALRRPEAARAQLMPCLVPGQGEPALWLAAGDALSACGDLVQARAAYEQARLRDPHRAAIEQARAALMRRERRDAEEIFRAILRQDAAHVGALCGLAAVSLASGAVADAKRLLRHALTQSRHLPLTLRGLAQALLEDGDLVEAEATLRQLLALEPENPQNWVTLGMVCTRLMRQDEALDAYTQAATLEPAEVGLRLSIGHLLKTLGRRAQCEAAYRQCLAMDPDFGEAYWALADLKNYTFDDADLAAMQRLLEDPASDASRRTQVQFALGRALENRGEHAAAFAAYEAGNRLRHAATPFSIATFEDKTRRVARFFGAEFFARHAGTGCPERAPVFVVGLPRSGSTLVEQILASHPAVEGTFELPNVLRIVREFDHSHPRRDGYPEALAGLGAADWTRLGERYRDETAPLRSGRDRFIDKMPNNFSHVGLIHAMLPNATIIDVRRHPLDACFSTYKQYFAEGQSFSYDLDDLGRYYRCYLSLMDHWHAVLPGRLLTLQYESLVREPEREIRRLLAHCGLGFDPACLAFHETRRAVRTASAEQVRQPLYASGIGYWRHYAAHLGPLVAALGDCLQRPEFLAAQPAAGRTPVD